MPPAEPGRQGLPLPERPGSTPAGSPSVQAASGRAFDLRAGASAAIAGDSLVLTFDRVVEDSRCPTGVACVWEGDAVVRLTLAPPSGAKGTIDLHTHVETGREAVFQRYRVRLDRLAPLPKRTGPIPADQYVATLIVTIAR